MNLESAYLRLPRCLQNQVVGIEGRRLNRRRYGGNYAAIAVSVQAKESFSETELQAYQAACLRRHLNSAAQTLFWKRKFAEFRVDVNARDPFVELSKLPILTKDEVRVGINVVRNPTVNSRELLSRHTSGTTGSGLVFAETREMEQITWATWWRYRNWHRIGREDWCSYFGGRSIVSLSQKQTPFWRVNRPGRQVLFSGYHLSSETVSDYVRGLSKYGASWIHGYPSMLALLASYVLAQRLKMPRIRIVTTGAENLSPSQKAMIALVFNAPVFQHYGQAEGVANISECPAGRLHVDEDYAGVEFVPIDGMPETFRIVGTNWHNAAFPLLRYDTGDVVTLDEQGPCLCGRLGRLVATIDGRQEDYVTLASGVRVGRMDHVFKDMVNIHEAQIVQRKDGEIDVRVVRSSHYSKSDERMLVTEFKKRLGKDIKVCIHYVDSLPRTRSGKLRLVVRE